MNVTPGQELLHYRVTEKIGAGGMGEVWRAADTSLGRDVAIKMVPEALAFAAERLNRFEREARLLASLNHPNIAGVYGLHEAEGARFIAMELVEGEDLSERIARGPLPVADALTIAGQIAEALDVAHEQGVIHRDLKPANIRLTASGQVKVLDFGLAKALAPETVDPGGTASMSPTVTSAGTLAGVIMGTAAYMSPEQAKGTEVDRRADIWSFGVVLHEMLTGRRMFRSETVSETLAAVIMKEIDLGDLPAGTPRQVRRLLGRCLEREPRSRLRDIGEARVILAEALESPEPAALDDVRPPWRRALPWALAAAGVLLAIAAWLLPATPPAVDAEVMRLALSLPTGYRIPNDVLPVMAVSPDGRHVVFVGETEDDEEQLYLRRIDQIEPTPLNGTNGAETPIFSPDGQWIAFAQEGKLKKIPVDGGPPMTLCDAPRMRGASWGGGVIVLAPDRSSGIHAVPDTGGELVTVTDLESDPSSLSGPSHRWPHVLPDGRTVLFTATANNSDYTESEIHVVSLDGGPSRALVRGNFPTYVAPGYLLFSRDTTLLAAPFDADRAELTGPAVPVLEDVRAPQFYGTSQYTVSTDGTLLYIRGSGSAGDRKLVWIDRDGKDTPAGSLVLPVNDFRLSPDGRRMVASSGGSSSDLWLVELDRDTRTRFTLEPEPDSSPIWSSDGEWIAFGSFRDGGINIFRRRADGSGEERQLTHQTGALYPEDWSLDGETILVTQRDPTNTDIYALRLGGSEPRLEAIADSAFVEAAPRFSPDGRWMAYVSTETGEAELYVRPASGEGRRVRVSTDGGTRPRWSPGTDELIYRRLTNESIVSVPYRVVDGEFVPGAPRPVFTTNLELRQFEFSPDGERLLADIDANTVAREAPVVVVNWARELEERVPR